LSKKPFHVRLADHELLEWPVAQTESVMSSQLPVVAALSPPANGRTGPRKVSSAGSATMTNSPFNGREYRANLVWVTFRSDRSDLADFVTTAL
jgi:hypothetical protein